MPEAPPRPPWPAPTRRVQGEGGDEVPALSLSGALACLISITLVVAVCSGGRRAHVELASTRSAAPLLCLPCQS